MPRSEVEQRFGALESKIDQAITTASEARNQINSRLDLIAGQTAGVDRSRQLINAGIAAVVGIIVIIGFVITLATK